MRALLLVAVLVLPFAGCASKTSGPKDDKIVVELTDNAFGVASVKAAPNQLVEWQNKGQNTHRIIVDEFGLGTSDIKPGSIGQLKFGALGSHGVHCQYHPEMKMVVEIVAQ